jgi:extradiol dioxygenase family protein
LSEFLRPFHLAFPVKDLEEAKRWYCNILGCSIGRESREWIDINFYGHQIVAHLSDEMGDTHSNEVDGDNVPVRHFGIILTPERWETLKDDLISKDVDFIIKANTRFKGSKGEQNTMFIKDPSGNALEFKSFRDDSMVFER